MRALRSYKQPQSSNQMQTYSEVHVLTQESISQCSVGMVFNRLTVLQEFIGGKDGRMWLCRCTCGTERPLQARMVRKGRTKSCGCLRAPRITGGHIATPEGYAWANMIDRCTNPKNKEYRNYGERGIKVCERWIHSLVNFLSDMGQRPSKYHSLERTDNNGDYKPSNCRWATSADQSRNRRTNRLITFNGQTLCLEDWAMQIKIAPPTLIWRLANWPIATALTRPSRKAVRR